MKTINIPKVWRDSLELVDAFNGFYLYGDGVNGETIFLGCMGDGVGNNLFEDYDPNDDTDLPDAYYFELVD